jgi:hypothetical protein
MALPGKRQQTHVVGLQLRACQRELLVLCAVQAVVADERATICIRVIILLCAKAHVLKKKTI